MMRAVCDDHNGGTACLQALLGWQRRLAWQLGVCGMLTYLLGASECRLPSRLCIHTRSARVLQV